MARSRAMLQNVPSLSSGYVKLRAQLVDEAVLVRAGDSLEFARDYTFSSPSQAAAVVLGRTANGWQEWRDGDSRSLKQLQQAASKEDRS